jgi:antitoxin ParD1/3/4
MKTMNISLPDQMKQYVDEQISKGRFSSVSEYVRGMIRLDQRGQAELVLVQYLAEGMEGPSTPFTDADVADICERGVARYNALQVEKKVASG